jgi:hypothetical protein
VTATLQCQSCGAALIVEAHERTTRCAYCASPSIVLRPASLDRPEPEFVIGFVVPLERALQTARHWLKRPLLAPEAFRRAEPAEVRGLYLPVYLYSATAYSDFEAQIGEHYTVVGGRKGTTRTETEWRTLRGKHASYVHDRVITASRGVSNAELEAIEPFDLRALHRYTSAVISGWTAEEASLAQEECLALARTEAVAAVGATLGPFMPGDKHKNLVHQTQLAEEHLALALLPIWVLAVRYAADKPPVRLLLNGQTGRLHGKAPLSTVKVTCLVLAILVVLAGLSALAQAGTR